MTDLELILAAARAAEAEVAQSKRLRSEYRERVLCMLSLVTLNALTDGGYAALYSAWRALHDLNLSSAEQRMTTRVYLLLSALSMQRTAISIAKSARAEAAEAAKVLGIKATVATNDAQPRAARIVSEYEAAVREYAEAHQARKNHSESREDSVPLGLWLSRRDELNDRVSSALRRLQELGRSK